MANENAIISSELVAPIINALKVAGVGSVLWHVRGSGDSPDGSDQYFYADREAAKKCAPWNDENKPSEELAKAFEAAYGSESDIKLDELCWEALDAIMGGWYNNEGGYGYVWITVGNDTEPTAIGSALFLYPEPEAQEHGRMSVWGPDLDGSEEPA